MVAVLTCALKLPRLSRTATYLFMWQIAGESLAERKTTFGHRRLSLRESGHSFRDEIVSFRLFIYYSGLGAAWAALIGWGLGRWLAPHESGDALRAAVQGLILGSMVALGMGLVDNLWNLPEKFARPPWFVLLAALLGPGALFALWYFQSAQEPMGARILALSILMLVVSVLFFLTVTTMLWNLGGKRMAWLAPAVLAGGVAGLGGGLAGQFLADATQQETWAVFGWALTGLLIGAAPGAYELTVGLVQASPVRPAVRKIRNGLIGGAAGGLMGSLFFYALQRGLLAIFTGDPVRLMSPGAVGFTALGGCIGAMVGWAQVVLRTAWVKVEAGFRPGRELILSKPETLIGRAEECDIGLFGGKGVERVHARIVQRGGQFVLADAGAPNGTYLNDKRIKNASVLRSGDLILVGNCALRFQERRRPKKAARQRPAREPEFKL